GRTGASVRAAEDVGCEGGAGAANADPTDQRGNDHGGGGGRRSAASGGAGEWLRRTIAAHDAAAGDVRGGAKEAVLRCTGAADEGRVEPRGDDVSRSAAEDRN